MRQPSKERFSLPKRNSNGKNFQARKMNCSVNRAANRKWRAHQNPQQRFQIISGFLIMKNRVSALALRVCFLCKKDLQNKQFFQCAQCEEREFCGLCFVDEENQNHCGLHSYWVIGWLRWSSAQKNSWSAFEELKILELFALKGYDNWGDFSLLLKTKSAEEIESFFHSSFNPRKAASLST